MSKCCCCVNQKRNSCADLQIHILVTTNDQGIPTYTFVIINVGPSVAKNVVLNVKFNGDITWKNPIGWPFTKDEGILELGNLPVGFNSETLGASPKLSMSTEKSSVTAIVTCDTCDCTHHKNIAMSSYDSEP